MFTVGSCTVLYNPNESVLTNLNSYSNCVDVSVVVDNSDTKNEISQSLKNNSNFIYIDMDGNKGIAAALNKGIEYLNSKNIDFALTMDQDSLFPTKYYPNILKLVDKYKTDYSVIGLNFNQDNGGLDTLKPKQMRFKEVFDIWILRYESTVKTNTFIAAKRAIELHILPFFGKYYINK